MIHCTPFISPNPYSHAHNSPFSLLPPRPAVTHSSPSSPSSLPQERSNELLIATDTAAKLSHELAESHNRVNGLEKELATLTKQLAVERKEAAETKVDVVLKRQSF
jgi:hypothetical protein